MLRYCTLVKLKKLLRFICVGFLALTIHLTSFKILFNYCTLSISISATSAYWVTVIFHFYFNKIFVFESINNSIWLEKLKYCFMLLFNYFLTMIGLYFVVNVLKYDAYLNIFFSTLTNAVSSYLWMSNFVFKNSK
jgi:putative flippase GtrA